MIRSFAAAGAAALLVQISAPAFAQPAPPTSTQGFVTAAAQSDEYERRAGRMAEKMGHAEGVRRFGARMVHDHTMTTQKLKAAIRSTGRPVPPPPPLAPDQQQMLDQLKSAGRGFDATYIDQQVQAHQQALSLMQGYARGGDNPAIRRVASQTVPLIRRHLDMAMHLQQTVRH